MSTEITTANAFSQLESFNIGSAMTEELAGLNTTFEKIKIPSAGSTVFEIPGEDGEADTVKEFSGVILYHHPMFSYYKEKYTGGSNVPDCGSFDGIIGNGTPGGECAQCPLNQFGSGENGSKACKNRRRIYILREGEVFPVLLSLPTGSLKEFTRYIKRLLSKGKKSNNVVTRFSLKKAVNQNGIAYSQAQFAIDRTLTPEEQKLIDAMSEQVKACSNSVGYEANESDELIVDPETGEVISPLK